MLSFDITDRNIRIVKGVESNGKIKISSAATLNLEEEVIINGHVKDVARVATLINGILKKNRMADKDAIVSISSNLTIFKELYVTRVKGQDFQKAVKQQMLSELNLDESYCVSYVIVGAAESQSEAGDQVFKILATACPIEIVNCYRDIFKMLGIALKSVMIGCNCITKVLLADTKIKSKMPLLAVQIDNNFISLNLYEQGQLSFSRFASIDATDYGNSADYVFEAVNENIFRMLQFHKSRNTGEIIENVIFYGDTHEFVRLTDELEKLDLKTSLINVPPQIHGHENLEFSLYANAIGAMFKRNKEIEKINLLETESATIMKSKMKAEGNGLAIMTLILIASGLIVGGIWAGLYLKDVKIRNNIEETQELIDSPKTKADLELYEKLLVMTEKVNRYNVMIENVHDAYNSKPIVLGEKYDKIEEVITKTAEELKISEAKIKNPQYSDGEFVFEVECDAVDEASQKYPAQLVENLLKEDMIIAVSYSNYTVAEDQDKDTGVEKEVVRFTLSLQIKGEESAYTAPETEKTEAE